MSHILVEKQGHIKLICWSDGRSLLARSNGSTREENALSELVELVLTQIICLAMTERRGSDSSISFHQFSGYSWAPIPCDVTVHAWPWIAGSPHLRCQVHAIFLTNASRGPCFFALSHLASRLTPLFGELATGLHVHQRDASLICSLFRPCRQALFGKGDRQVAFCPDEISKNDHMPERNAALVGLAPSGTAIDSTARF